MKLLNKYLLILLSVTTLSSCVKEKLEVTYNNQETRIDQYISTNMYKTTTENGVSKTDTLRVVYNGGANRLILKEGIGEELTSKGTAAIYYAGYTFTGNKSASNLFVTNHEETAKSAGWSLTDEDYSIHRINMADDELIDGLKKGLMGVCSGEHCQILFSGKYAFGKKTHWHNSCELRNSL